MKKMLAQQQTFQQQMQHMVAEATRRETKERQARIAAAARTYQEQADRQRAAQEKLAAERAAADRVRETQEAKRAAERPKDCRGKAERRDADYCCQRARTCGRAEVVAFPTPLRASTAVQPSVRAREALAFYWS